MAAADTGSIVTLDADGRPAGILTDSDLRRRVVALGLDHGAALASVVTTPVVTIDRAALGFQAVALMLERGIHHLVVVDERGRALAVLADSDLLALEAAEPLYLARRVERAATIDDLSAAHGSYATVASLLLDAGAQAHTVLAILAETNDRLQRRLLAFAESELGPAPAPFVWLVMGSEGRRTQTLRTDQDNGIAWRGEVPDAPAYFARLAAWMVAALERLGFPRCPGDVLATNDLWRAPLDTWKERFAHWLEDPEPVALLRALIAFDFRGAGGDTTIASELRGWLMARTPHAGLLHVHCARDVLRRSPPLGALGRLRLDPTGAFDAKADAIGIVVDSARLFALELGFGTTSTLERLRLAGDDGALPPEDARDVVAAYTDLQRLRLRRQIALVRQGLVADNGILVRELGRADRAAMREHLSAIERLQRGVRERYAHAVRV